MKKKILIFGILAVLMLLAISFASTVTSDTSKPLRRESPLFGVRAKRVIKEKIVDFIRARFIGERVFWLPIPLFRKNDFLNFRDLIRFKSTCEYVTCCGESCRYTMVPGEYCETVHITCSS